MLMIEDKNAGKRSNAGVTAIATREKAQARAFVDVAYGTKAAELKVREI